MSRLEALWYPETPDPLWREALLSPLSALALAYGSVTSARRWLYDRGVLPSRAIEGLKVLSVGNVNVGGTGKTPAVIHLAQALSRLRKVAVLSRGYGRKSSGVVLAGPGVGADQLGDEPALIARRCPEAIVLVGADRALLAQRAHQELEAQVAILDDGLQHLRLRRDADVVVVDADASFGNGRLLPRGPLRESRAVLERAQLVWLRVGQRADPPPDLPSAVPVVVVRQRVEGLVNPQGTLLPPDALQGAPVLAFAGIARPRRFLSTVESLRASVVESAFFDDHALYSPLMQAQLKARASEKSLALLTTEKDAMRLPDDFGAWQVRWGIEVVSGQDHLDDLLSRC
jgi:tetraacyldisaccharide 4'-kinase